MDNMQRPLRNLGSWQSSHCMYPNINEGCEIYTGFTKKDLICDILFDMCHFQYTMFFYQSRKE